MRNTKSKARARLKVTSKKAISIILSLTLVLGMLINSQINANAASGSLSPQGTIDKGYHLKVDYSESNKDPEAMTSKVTVTAYLVQDADYSLNISATKNVTININGSSKDFSFTSGLHNSGGVTTKLASWSCTVSHPNDKAITIPISARFDIAATLSGTYYSNISTSDDVTLDKLDTTAPTYALSLGHGTAATSNKDNTPTFSATSCNDSESGIASGSFYIDGTAHAATLSGTTYSYTPTALSNGSHTVYFKIVDKASNTATSSTYTYFIDAAAPLYTFSNPGHNTAATADVDNRPTFSATSCSDTPSGIASAYFYIDTKQCEATLSGTTYSYTPPTALTNGSHTVYFTITDKAGNTATSSASTYTYYIDATPPAFTFNPGHSTPTTADKDNTPTFSATSCSDALSGIASAYFYIDGKENKATLSGTTYSYTPSTALTEGAHTVSFKLVDKAGNAASSTTFTYYIDATAPVYTFGNPGHNTAPTADKDNTPTFNATSCSDAISGIASAYFYIDTKQYAATLSGTTYSYTPPTLADGAHTIYFQITDKAGNTVSSATFSYYIDATVPVYTFGNPGHNTPNTADKNNKPTFSATNCSDALSGINTAYFYIDGKGYAATLSGTTFSYTSPTALTEGAHTVYFQITDKAGNVVSSTTYTYYIDTTTPLYKFIPGHNTPETADSNNRPIFSAINCSDAVSGIATAYFYIDGIRYAATLSGTTYSYQPNTELSDGLHTVYFVITDKVGNTSPWSSYDYYIDPTAPSYKFDPGHNTADTADKNNVPTFSASDCSDVSGIASAYFYIDGTAYEAIQSGTTYSYTPDSELSDGSHDVYFEITDNAGMQSTSSTYTYFIDQTAPTYMVNLGHNTAATADSSSKPLFSATNCTDEVSGIKSAYFYIDGTAYPATFSGEAYSYAPTTALLEGSHTVYFKITDNSGNSISTLPYTYYIDLTAPSYTFNNPGHNSTTTADINNKPTFSATNCTDALSDIESAYFYIDDIAYAATLSGTSYSYTPTVDLSGGSHTVYFKITDNAGNLVKSSNYTYYIDSTAPTYTFKPGHGSAVMSDSNNMPTFSATNCSDATSGIASAYVYIDGTAYEATHSGMTYSYTPTIALSDGAHTVYFKITDNVGNTTSSSIFTYYIDPTASSYTFNPGHDSATMADSNNKPTFSASNCTDTTGGIESVYFFIDGTAYEATRSDMTYSYTPTTELSDGTHVVYLQITDNAGNMTLSSPFDYFIDTTKPSFTLEESVKWSASNSVTVNISELGSGVKIQKWAIGNVSENFFISNGTQFTGKSFLAPKNGVYTVYVQDYAGNSVVQTVTVGHIFPAQPIGTFTESFTDFSEGSNGIAPTFGRVYSSANSNIGPFGRGWTFSLQGSCKIYQYDFVDDMGNNQVGTLSNLEEVNLPDGSTYIFELTDGIYTAANTRDKFTKNDDGTYTLTDTTKVKYHFNANGYLDSITDQNGNKQTITVDSTGKISEVKDSVNRIYTFKYNDDGTLDTITDPAGRVFGYQYKDGILSASLSPTGVAVESYGYDSFNYLDTIKDAFGHTTEAVIYNHDDKDRIRSITDENGVSTSYQYDDMARSMTETSSDKTITITTFDEFIRPISTSENTKTTGTTSYSNLYDDLDTVVDSDGNTTKYVSNNDGNITSAITKDINGRITENDTLQYTFDSINNITKSVETAISTSYASDGTSTTETTTTTTNYDSNGNMLYHEVNDGTTDSITSDTYKSDGQIDTDTASDGTVTSYAYDQYGYQKEITTTPKNGTSTTVTIINNIIGMPTSQTDANKVETTNVFNSLGNVVKQTVKSSSESRITRSVYDEYGRVKQQISPMEYNEGDDNLTNVQNGIASVDRYNDTNIGTKYFYNSTTGKLSKLNVSSYDVGIDSTGNVTDVSTAGNNLANYIYSTDEKELLNEINYTNKDKINFHYQPFDDATRKVKDISINDTTQYTYSYDDDGNLTSKYNAINDTTTSYITNSDDSTTITVTKGKLDGTESGQNNENNVIDKYTISSDGNGLLDTVGNATYGLNIDTTNNIDTFSKDSITEYTKSYSTGTDDSTTTSIKKSDNTLITSSDAYDKASQTRNYKNEITWIEQEGDYKVSHSTKDDITYNYDVFGNIKTVSKNGVMENHYYYDQGDELLRDDDVVQNKTFSYEYDKYGNILNKYTYDYTTGESLTGLTPSSTISYKYENVAFPDEMTSYIVKDNIKNTSSSNDITYDALGNPLSYIGWDMKWTAGRELASMSNGTDKISYQYDDNGIRTSKTVNGVTTSYTTINGNTTSQSDSVNTLYFRYDKNNQLVGFNLNGTEYIYLLSGQGDVMGILDNTGKTIVNYSYDAWGNCTITSDTSGSNLGNINPMRYRGYYLDGETGFYYLQSRYYNPQSCRLINADEPTCINTSNSIGVNLFAYCSNNPIVNIDTTGRRSKYIEDQFSKTQVGSFTLYGRSGKDAMAICCGAVASYNTLVAFSRKESFASVTNYYNKHHYFTDPILGFVSPHSLMDFFVDRGFYVSEYFTTSPTKVQNIVSQHTVSIIAYYWEEETIYRFVPLRWKTTESEFHYAACMNYGTYITVHEANYYQSGSYSPSNFHKFFNTYYEKSWERYVNTPVIVITIDLPGFSLYNDISNFC